MYTEKLINFYFTYVLLTILSLVTAWLVFTFTGSVIYEQYYHITGTKKWPIEQCWPLTMTGFIFWSPAISSVCISFLIAKYLDWRSR